MMNKRDTNGSASCMSVAFGLYNSRRTDYLCTAALEFVSQKR